MELQYLGEDAESAEIAFLDIVAYSSWYRCGLLVLDGHGVPRELRVTEALQPTKVQRMAYGSSLDLAILRVCSEPLFDKMDSNPNCVLVRDRSFLQLDGDHPPFVQIALEGSEEADEMINEFRDGPYALARQRSMTKADTKRLLNDLTALHTMYGFDAMEPFERIGDAVETIKVQESKDK